MSTEQLTSWLVGMDLPFALATGSSSSACIPYNFSANAQAENELWGWQGWYVLVDIFCLFFVLFFELMPIEFAMVAAVLMLCIADIISVAEMTAGFSNAGILAVVCLFILAEALTATGAIDYFLGKLLGTPKTLGQALIRMMVPCSFVAAWISSTAVVALMIPIVQRWAKKINQPPSMLMLPMCYAVHLGGTVTLVGTTTNLVISGLYNSYFCQTMGIFELSTVGLPVAIAGVGCLLLLGPKTLPSAQEYERRTTSAYAAEKHRPSFMKRCARFFCWCRGETQKLEEMPNYHSDFTFDALIPASLAGKSIEQAGLRALGEDLFLTTVLRNYKMSGENNTNPVVDGETQMEEEVKIFHAVGPDFILAAGDRVSFAGAPDNFLAFCREHDLIPVVEGSSENSENAVDEEGFGRSSSSTATAAMKTLEAVVSASSELVGKSMREVNFRSRYSASVLAIHRSGEKINPPGNKLGQVTLKIGDILLLLIVNDKFSWDAPETKRDLKPRALASSSRASSLQQAAARGGGNDAKPGVVGGPSEYIFSMKVATTRRLAGVRLLGGLTLEQAGLTNIPGVAIVAITRGEVTNQAVDDENLVLEPDDVIWFSGSRDGLSSLRRIPGLDDMDLQQVQQLGIPAQNRRLVEVVVSLNSDLLYKTVKESKFRTRFQAAIVSIQRRDQRVLARIGDIELEPGDVLILDAGPDFAKRFAKDENFLVISEVEQSTPPRMDRFYIATLAAIAMIVATAATGMDLLVFALFACGIVLAFGVLTRDRAHKSVDWKIIITVGASFGLSTALTRTKVATVVGFAITNLAISTGTGEIGVLTVVLIFTEILCALITAKAGALLMFPIAMNAAFRLNMSPLTMSLALMLGASDYTTPQGHQTNLMVLSPGAYKFVDYQKLGIPLEIFLNVIQIVCLGFVQYWYLTTVGAVFILFACIVIDHSLVNKLPLARLGEVCPCSCRRHRLRLKREDEEDGATKQDPFQPIPMQQAHQSAVQQV